MSSLAVRCCVYVALFSLFSWAFSDHLIPETCQAYPMVYSIYVSRCDHPVKNSLSYLIRLLFLKVSSQEFSLDSDEVFAIVLSDSRFQEVRKSLGSHTETGAIRNAMDFLFEVAKTEAQALTHECIFIMSLFQQWTIRCICKRLMQIMTPEALVLHHKSLPSSYIQNYLQCQYHFNLKNLISHYLSSRQ